MVILLILLSIGISLAEISHLQNDRDVHDEYKCIFCQPDQIHIAFGEQTNSIVVTWSTYNMTDTMKSLVQYGTDTFDQEAEGSFVPFVDGGDMKRVQYIHRVVLNDLQFDTRYVYHCGSQYGWSERFSFKVPPKGEDWVVRAAIYGDMGSANAHSLPYLQDEAERDNFDMILHVGDFAYDMYEQDGENGDQFMRQIQPLAAIVPYMTCPGNHEEKYNFSHYKNRFSMPGSYESMFYSWDLGPIHFVAVNTEAYYFLNYGVQPLANLYTWLQDDLKKANDPKNRQKHPWIIIFGHRPMYCSDHDPDCLDYLPNRIGLPLIGLGMEPLLKEYGVDLVIWAHEHSYERTWPLYDLKVYNGSYDKPYVNPGAPVHIVTGSAGCREVPDPFVSPVHMITGSAGCREGRDHFKRNTAKWSAFHSQDYGYTKFKAYNKTHINIEQISVDQDGQVIDSFWLVKTKKNHTFDLP